MPPESVQRLDELARSIEAHDWDRCADQTFRLLHPLPDEAGIEVAGDVVARYLPLLHDHVPGLEWPPRIVHDPREWYRRHGRATPDEPAHLTVSDETWFRCLDALLLGAAAGVEPGVTTAARATAIVTAVASRALAVWETDDPEAVGLWREGVLPPWRAYPANAPARAVLEREWSWVSRRLSAAVGGPARTGADDDDVLTGLQRWRDHEYRLIVPAPG